MNVEEDYGELSSVARSGNVIDMICSSTPVLCPVHAVCLLRWCKDCSPILQIINRLIDLPPFNYTYLWQTSMQARVWKRMPQYIWWICEMVYGKSK